MRRTLALLGLLVVVVLTAAAAGDFDIRTLLATVGVGMIIAASKIVWERQQVLSRWRHRIDTALWGPEDDEGKRDGGLVDGMKRVELACSETAVQATTAASAARESQRIILEAIAEMKKERRGNA